MRRIGGPGTGLYWHLGFILKKHVRDWDARGYRSSTGNPRSKITWTARKQHAPKYTEQMFDTRRDAVTWIEREAGYERSR